MPSACALSNLRRHWPVWIFHTLILPSFAPVISISESRLGRYVSQWNNAPWECLSKIIASTIVQFPSFIKIDVIHSFISSMHSLNSAIHSFMARLLFEPESHREDGAIHHHEIVLCLILQVLTELSGCEIPHFDEAIHGAGDKILSIWAEFAWLKRDFCESAIWYLKYRLPDDFSRRIWCF